MAYFTSIYLRKPLNHACLVPEESRVLAVLRRTDCLPALSPVNREFIDSRTAQSLDERRDEKLRLEPCLFREVGRPVAAEEVVVVDSV